MYIYKITSTLANKEAKLSFTEAANLATIKKCIDDINAGVAFSKTKKRLKLVKAKSETLIMELSSEKPLSNPGKSYAGFSRLLVKRSDVFRDCCKHQKLFLNKIVSMKTSLDNKDLPIDDLEASKLVLEILFENNNKSIDIRKEAKDELLKIVKDYKYERDLLDLEVEDDSADMFFPNDEEGYSLEEYIESKI